MTSFERGAFVARHPALTAMFFHEIMAHFLNIVVCADGESPGLFGQCEAYYGMVEAQGRGTLHCHLLLWLSGNPNPQLLCDQMQSSLEYRQGVIQWLETNIRCELPGQRTVAPVAVKPARPAHEMDPRLEEAPVLDSMDQEDFAQEFQCFVTWLAVACKLA